MTDSDTNSPGGSSLPLYILGAGGHGKVVLDAARSMNRFPEIFFLDSHTPLHGSEVLGVTVVGDTDHLPPPADACIFVAFGFANGLRVQLIDNFLERGYRVPVIIHSTAWIAEDVRDAIGPGTVCMARSVVNPGTVLGKGCIINTAATVDHDCALADGVHISPGANIAGNVSVGARAHIGTGVSTRHGKPDAKLIIGEDSVIGAGAAIVEDIPPMVTAVGVPARILKS